MVGHAKYSYHAAYVSTVVIGTCILAFTIGILVWRMCQRRRTESLDNRGAEPNLHLALDGKMLPRLFHLNLKYLIDDLSMLHQSSLLAVTLLLRETSQKRAAAATMRSA